MDASISSLPDPRAARLVSILGRLWRPVAVGAGALVVAVGVLALTRTGLLHVRAIEVDGASHLSRREVIEHAGVSREANAVWLDDAEAERRLEALPWVASAVVHVDLPWTVTITVTERSPVALVDRAGVTTLIAADGTNLGSPSHRADLPTVAPPPPWIAGAGDRSVGEVASALGAMDADLRREIRRVTLGPSGIGFVLRDGVRVTYGSGSSAEAKARAIAAILRWVEDSGEAIRSINVTAPSAPAVVPVG